MEDQVRVAEMWHKLNGFLDQKVGITVDDVCRQISEKIEYELFFFLLLVLFFWKVVLPNRFVLPSCGLTHLLCDQCCWLAWHGHANAMPCHARPAKKKKKKALCA